MCCQDAGDSNSASTNRQRESGQQIHPSETSSSAPVPAFLGSDSTNPGKKSSWACIFLTQDGPSYYNQQRDNRSCTETEGRKTGKGGKSEEWVSLEKCPRKGQRGAGKAWVAKGVDVIPARTARTSWPKGGYRLDSEPDTSNTKRHSGISVRDSQTETPKIHRQGRITTTT